MKPLSEAEASAYAEVGNYERHFNSLQAGLRVVASTWMAATVGAVGFVLRGGEDGLKLPIYLVVGGTCLLGSLGIVLIWILDQLVYQKLLGAAFLTGLAMELDSRTLPPTRVFMRFRLHSGANWTLWFYFLPLLTLSFGTVASMASCIVHARPASRHEHFGVAVTEMAVLVLASITQLASSCWVWNAGHEVGVASDAEAVGGEISALCCGEVSKRREATVRFLRRRFLCTRSLVPFEVDTRRVPDVASSRHTSDPPTG